MGSELARLVQERTGLRIDRRDQKVIKHIGSGVVIGTVRVDAAERLELRTMASIKTVVAAAREIADGDELTLDILTTRARNYASRVGRVSDNLFDVG